MNLWPLYVGLVLGAIIALGESIVRMTNDQN